MLLLELFCGSKSISKQARLFGIKTVTLDNNKKYNPDICIDILKWDYKKLNLKPNIIWASPVCTSWSIACHKHRTLKDNLKPKTECAKNGELLIYKTIEIINYFKPKLWFIENPRGRLRHFKPMIELEKNNKRYNVHYGDYGFQTQKPTDIWTNLKKWDHRKGKIKKNILFENIKKKNRSVIPSSLCNEIIYNCINQY